MGNRVEIPFKITAWDQTAFDETPGAPSLARATVKKTYSGAIEGTGTAELLMYVAEDGAATYRSLH